MKKIYSLLLTVLITSAAFGQTQPGDIAFTAFNVDGGDDFAFVTLVDINPSTTIFFTDNEVDPSGNLTSGEGVLEYTSPTTVTTAGTIILISDASTSGRSANTGSISSVSGSLNLAGGGDALFAYIGTATAPSAFLAGIQNELNNEGSLAGAGLVEGDTFFTYTTSGSPDGGKYIGARDTEIAFSDYRAIINQISNWTVENTNGELILPIDETAFTLNTLSTQEVEKATFSMYPNPTSNGFVNIKTSNNAATQVAVYDILGKQVINTTLNGERLNVSKLNAGVYAVRLSQGNTVTTKKLVIK